MSDKNISSKLVEIQRELKAPKGQFNSFGKYNYRSCEDIVEAVKPLVHAAGLLLIITDEIVQVGDRIYVKAVAMVTDGENNMTAVAYAREPESKKGMDEAQITGATSSYARKYALNGLFAIDDTKDADTQAPQEPIKKKDDFLEHMEKAREMVGDEDYFKALNDFKYNKAEEVKDIDKDVVLEELRSIVRHNQNKDVWEDGKGDQGK